MKDLADPSFLIVDRSGRHLYSAHDDGTQVTSYQIDQTTGRLTVLNQQPTGGLLLTFAAAELSYRTVERAAAVARSRWRVRAALSAEPFAPRP